MSSGKSEPPGKFFSFAGMTQPDVCLYLVITWNTPVLFPNVFMLSGFKISFVECELGKKFSILSTKGKF